MAAMSGEQKRTSSGAAADAARSYVFSMRKKLLCALATATLASGFGLQTYDAFGPSRSPAEPAAKAGGTSALAGKNAFLPEGVGPSQPTKNDSAAGPTPEPGSVSTWSPLLVKGGGGFLMGFCIGFFLRKFLRMSAAIVGFVLVGLFAAQYLGWVNVDWTTVQEQLGTLGARLSAEFENFRTFLTGMLPAGGLGALGLVTGFKRQ
jgi:uncharacterized membrane protein (Fun14 family)